MEIIIRNELDLKVLGVELARRRVLDGRKISKYVLNHSYGLDPRTVNLIENGAGHVGILDVIKYCDVLGVKVKFSSK